MNSALYLESLKQVNESSWINFSNLHNKSILITGATGQVGSCIIDALLYRNRYYNSNITIYALSRNQRKLAKRFNEYIVTSSLEQDGDIIAVTQDVRTKLQISQKMDYIIHAASNTNPALYTNDPIGTITTNITGLQNVIQYAAQYQSRILYTSSVEIYGESYTGKPFVETDQGYIDCNTLRAGYPEAKRTCESLCQAYIEQFNGEAVIARLCAIYGPTAQETDQKAVFQFLHNALDHRDIVLKTPALQQRSFCYSVDAACAILTILLNGKKGEAYNVADDQSNFRIRDVAKKIALQTNVQIKYDLPPESEAKGFSPVSSAVMNSNKLQALGWLPYHNMDNGLQDTITILTEHSKH